MHGVDELLRTIGSRRSVRIRLGLARGVVGLLAETAQAPHMIN
jgi:hypothetical protein